MDKLQLRKRMRSRLSEIDVKQRKIKSQNACRILISSAQFRNASVIMIYLSLPEEVDTAKIALSAWQLEKTVVVPNVIWDKKYMIPVQIHSLEDDFTETVPGLRNPVNCSPVPIGDIDLVVTPGIAFDKFGNRLGRGGAYYDRFFADKSLKAIKCGFGFSEQLVDKVPTTSTDVAMDFLVTDEKIIYINN